MSYVLISDSTCDLPSAMVEKLDLVIMPLSFSIAGREYYDDFWQNITMKDFYEYIRQGNQSKTTLINTQRYIESFIPYLEDGKDVVCIAFSSALSGSCQCAMQAAEELRGKYPERKIWVVDSLCASAGEGLLVYAAAKKRLEGVTAEDLVKWVVDNRLRLIHWFTVDDINHLYRGGRVSKTAAVLGTALKIKPVMHVDNEGRLINMEKVMGRKKSLSTVVKRMVERADTTQDMTFFIGHGDCEEDALFCARLLRQSLPTIECMEIMPIGPVIGAHSGPGTIAIFCFGNPR